MFNNISSALLLFWFLKSPTTNPTEDHKIPGQGAGSSLPSLCPLSRPLPHPLPPSTLLSSLIGSPARRWLWCSVVHRAQGGTSSPGEASCKGPSHPHRAAEGTETWARLTEQAWGHPADTDFVGGGTGQTQGAAFRKGPMHGGHPVAAPVTKL